MRLFSLKPYVLILVKLSIPGYLASQSFTFNCNIDTTIVRCGNTCFTLNAIIPDIHAISNSYTVNPLGYGRRGCFPVYSNPDILGTPTNLTLDDRYTPIVPIGFSFPFYGTINNSLVVSTNGAVSFDLSRAGLFAHYDIENAIPIDLPSVAYDRSVILGVYHDLNPTIIQPTQLIHYTTIGITPYRKWILSYYKVPLFGTSCGGLFENTHQLVLYESTGIIEVLVFSKQICMGWNQGKAIIGIQNFSKNQGLMAPGRRGSDPPWGTVNMNEGWRFVPSAGPSLLKRVELTDLSGNLIITGSTTDLGNGKLEAAFPNLCPPTSSTISYIVRSVYTKFDDPSTEIYGSDTLRVTVAPGSLGINASITAVGCYGQANGIIKVAGLGGAKPYQYSIDGVNWQSDSTFNVPAGTYNVSIRDANLCAISQSVTVTEPPALAAVSSTSNASCNGGNDGRITVTASGGSGAFQYSLDGQNFQASNIFNVGPGTYTATVKDNSGCIFTIPNILVDLTNDLSFTAPAGSTICEGSSTQLSINSNALQYSWTPSTGLSGTSVSNPTASPTSTTTYNVRLTYGRCTADVPVTVNVNPAPIADAGADGFICYGQTFQLQGSGGVEYSWSPATYLDDASKNNPLASPDKTTTYTLSVKDAVGCSSVIADAVTIDVTPPILVSTFPSDTITYTGDQIRLLATSVATDYLWTPSLGLSDPTVADPLFTAGSVGDVMQYKVTGFTRAGCKGEAYVTIKVYKGPDLYVPTGFTPNGDGRNDRFFPFPVGIKSIKYFRVFNRWGQLLFSTSTPNDGWDGKFGGQEQPNGVYVWTVEGLTQDNKIIIRRGTVMLIR